MIRYAVMHAGKQQIWSGKTWRPWSRGNNGKLFTSIGYAKGACRIAIAIVQLRPKICKSFDTNSINARLRVTQQPRRYNVAVHNA